MNLKNLLNIAEASSPNFHSIMSYENRKKLYIFLRNVNNLKEEEGAATFFLYESLCRKERGRERACVGGREVKAAMFKPASIKVKAMDSSEEAHGSSSSSSSTRGAHHIIFFMEYKTF